MEPKHDIIPAPTKTDKIVDIAIDLVDENAAEGSGELDTAIFYVPSHDEFNGRYPSLTINVPKEEHSSRYQWRAELTFGNQDARTSSHVLVRKDGTVIVSGYDGKSAGTILSDDQIKSLAEYLEEIKSSLILDPLASVKRRV